MTDNNPWWWPELVTPEWRARIRADYPEETAVMDDVALDEYYAEGWRYADTWDHLGDARSEYEFLADAFLKLVDECGKSPRDFAFVLNTKETNSISQELSEVPIG